MENTKYKLIIFIACFFVIAACQTRRKHKSIPSPKKIASYLKRHPDELDTLRKRGPAKTYRYRRKVDLTRKISTNIRVFSPIRPKESLPIIISTASEDLEDEAIEQGRLLASWGYFVIQTEFASNLSIVKKSHRLTLLLSMIKSWPYVIDLKLNIKNIVLTAYGREAETVILAAKKIVTQGIVLQAPIIKGKIALRSIAKVKSPTIMIRPDPYVTQKKPKSQVFKKYTTELFETAISGASFADLQPAGWQPNSYGGSYQEQISQELFMTSIVSLTSGEGFKLSQTYVHGGLARRRLKNARLKTKDHAKVHRASLQPSLEN